MPTPQTNMTYDLLVFNLQQYRERSDPAYVESIPTFINSAENRLATEMKQLGFQCVVTNTFDLSPVQSKPSFWRETTSFSYQVNGVWKQIYLRSLEYVRAYSPNAGLADSPRYYADYDINHFYLSATPASAYPFELVYQARLDPLGPDHQTNWMTLNAPQALLYASLLEAALWAKADADVAMWKTEYGEAVGGLVAESRERLQDRGTAVTKG